VVHEFKGAGRGDVQRRKAKLAGSGGAGDRQRYDRISGNYLATFTIGYKAMRYNSFDDQLKQFHGNKARFDVGREWYSLYPEQPAAIEMKASVEKKKPGSFNSAAPSHIRNFLEWHSQP